MIVTEPNTMSVNKKQQILLYLKRKNPEFQLNLSMDVKAIIYPKTDKFRLETEKLKIKNLTNSEQFLTLKTHIFDS